MIRTVSASGYMALLPIISATVVISTKAVYSSADSTTMRMTLASLELPPLRVVRELIRALSLSMDQMRHTISPFG